MSQQILIKYPMGNCLTCHKIPSLSESQTTASLEKDGKEDFEHTSNGNSRGILASENFGSLHRDKSLLSFYSRKPPLGKSTNNNETKLKEVSEAKLIALFDGYKDSESPDYILAEGVERFLSDLNLSPDEFKVLALAWRLNAETMCQFSRTEFITGLKNMRTDSIKSISLRLPDLCDEILNDPELFKDLYRYTFQFGLDEASGERILSTDMAVCLWKIVFSLREPPVLEKWLKFLESHPHVKGIPRDTWNMFLNFVEVVGNDLSSYDDSEAWPSLFDDFVEYENDQMNQNISKEKEEIMQDCDYDTVQDRKKWEIFNGEFIRACSKQDWVKMGDHDDDGKSKRKDQDEK